MHSNFCEETSTDSQRAQGRVNPSTRSQRIVRLIRIIDPTEIGLEDSNIITKKIKHPPQKKSRSKLVLYKKKKPADFGDTFSWPSHHLTDLWTSRRCRCLAQYCHRLRSISISGSLIAAAGSVYDWDDGGGLLQTFGWKLDVKSAWFLRWFLEEFLLLLSQMLHSWNEEILVIGHSHHDLWRGIFPCFWAHVRAFSCCC